MSELDKLEKYLKEKGIFYSREDEEQGFYNKHQIIVFDENREIQWDAICQRGSYGYEQGLLEIYGRIVSDQDEDSVVGWLTAEDVIKRLEN